VFGGAFISVYFLPLSLAQLFFVGFFIYAYNSKHYGILAAFYMVLLMNPLFLFKSTDLPVFSLGKGFSFGVFDILGFLLLIKAIRTKNRFLFRKNIFVLLIFISLFFVLSFFDGSNVIYAVRTYRSYLFLTSYFVFAVVFGRKDDFEDFINICFAIALLGVFDQILSLVTGKYLMTYLTSKVYPLITFTGGRAIRAFPSSFLLIYFIFVYVFNSIIDRKGRLRFGHMYLAIFTLSILISTTRQWLINLVIVFLFTGLFTRRAKQIILFATFAGVFLVVGLLNLNIINREYLSEEVIPRYETIGDIFTGDYTSVQPRVLDYKNVSKNAFNNFFFGMGFRADHTKLSNDISGFLNNIVRFGIFVAFMFLFIFFTPIRKLYLTIKRTGNQQLWTLIFIWVALLQQFLTVHDFFSFGYPGICLMMLMLAYTEKVIIDNLGLITQPQVNIK
jgi:hypothetical protein